jgi:hypothetical protein
MAQKVHVEMVDDLDGSEATQTVPFSLDGILYEIDLSDENATHLRDELAKYVASATRTGGRKLRLATGQSAAPVAATREKNQEIRGWAQANGYAISDRGRLSAEVVEAYEAAQAAPVDPEPEPPTKAPRKRAPRKKAADAAAS